MLCALVIRGINSIENRLTPVCARLRMTSGAPSGSAKPMTVCPERRDGGSAGTARTWRTMSDDLKRSDRDTSVAPCARYMSSVKPAAVPAPASTATSSPDFRSPGTAAGTTATRASPGHVSLGMPTLMGSECSRFHFLSHSTMALPTAGVTVFTGRVPYSETSPVSAGVSR